MPPSTLVVEGGTSFYVVVIVFWIRFTYFSVCYNLKQIFIIKVSKEFSLFQLI